MGTPSDLVVSSVEGPAGDWDRCKFWPEDFVPDVGDVQQHPVQGGAGMDEPVVFKLPFPVVEGPMQKSFPSFSRDTTGGTEW